MSVVRTSLAALALAGAIALSGCTDPSVSPTSEVNPTPTVEGNQRDFENATLLAACLTERGWDVEVTPGGGWGIEIELADEQADLYREDFDSCLEETGLDEVEMDEELANFVYDNNLRVIECLAEAGYSAEEPPDRDIFVAKIMETPDALIWDPFSLVPQGELPQAVMACPQ